MKVVSLGPSGAGKTSLIDRLCRGTFDPERIPTIGISWLTKTLETSEGSVRLELWDTAGQERYGSLSPVYCRGASAVLLVYDSSSQESSDHISQWYDHAKTCMAAGAVVVVVAAKSDLTIQSGAVVPPGYVESEKLVHMECSSKTSQGVDELFQYVAQEIMTRRTAGILASPGDLLVRNHNMPQSDASGCPC